MPNVNQNRQNQKNGIRKNDPIYGTNLELFIRNLNYK